MNAHLSHKQLDNIAKSAKKLENADALLSAPVGSVFIEQGGKESIVTSRYFQFLPDETVSVTVFLASETYYTAITDAPEKAHSYSNQYDIFVSIDQGRTTYATYSEKIIFNSDTPTRSPLNEALPTLPPIATRHADLKGCFRFGALPAAGGGYSLVRDRALYELDDGNSKLVVLDGSRYYELDEPSTIINSHLRLGDFYIKKGTAPELQMVYGLDIANGITTPLTVPVYLPPLLLAAGIITSAVANKLFLRRKKIAQPEKLFQACLNSYFYDSDAIDGERVVTRFFNFTEGVVTLVTAPISGGGHKYYYAVVDDPADLYNHCTSLDIIIETVDDVYVYKYLQSKKVNDQGEVEIVSRPIPALDELNGTSDSAALSAFQGSYFHAGGKRHLVSSRTLYSPTAGTRAFSLETTEGDRFEHQGIYSTLHAHMAIGDFHFYHGGPSAYRIYGASSGAAGGFSPLSAIVYLPQP